MGGVIKMSPKISARVLPSPRPGGCPPYPGIWVREKQQRLDFSQGEVPAVAASGEGNSRCVCVSAGARPAGIPARNRLHRAVNPPRPGDPAQRQMWGQTQIHPAGPPGTVPLQSSEPPPGLALTGDAQRWPGRLQ